MGTLVANLLACAIGYVLLTTKGEAKLEGTGLAVVDAVMNGALGSLSTASTWSAEVWLHFCESLTVSMLSVFKLRAVYSLACV